MALAKAPNKRLKKFFDSLGPEFDNYLRCGTSLLNKRVEHLLSGFNFYPTVIDNDMRWVHYFVQPLFIPFPGLMLEYGDRIPKNLDWGMKHFPQWVAHQDDSNVQATRDLLENLGLPNLQGMDSLDGFYSYLLGRTARSKRLDDWETIIATAIWLGDLEQTTEHLTRALEVADEREIVAMDVAEAERLWHKDLTKVTSHDVECQNRIMRLQEALATEGLPKAREILREWERYTVAELGIEHLYNPKETRR